MPEFSDLSCVIGQAEELQLVLWRTASLMLDLTLEPCMLN